VTEHLLPQPGTQQGVEFLREVLRLGASSHCSDIFDKATVSLLGATPPVCVSTDPSRLLVYLGYRLRAHPLHAPPRQRPHHDRHPHLPGPPGL